MLSEVADHLMVNGDTKKWISHSHLVGFLWTHLDTRDMSVFCEDASS